jgi:hypothetical protein
MEKKKPGGLKEVWRKFIVSLKRRPQNIAMAALIITFLYYALHLTSISNTTAKIQGQGMGLCGFCVMLFSMLSFMCFINAFPYRKKVNVPMLVLMLAMFAIIAVADVIYLRAIYSAISRPDNPIVVTMNTIYIAYAEYYLRMHLVLLGVTTALIALLPVYSKLIRKIKTSIEVESYGSMDAIDISGE